MAYYQEEHFARMKRIESNLPGRNLPSTMPIWTLRENRLPVVGRPGHIQYRHPNEPVEHCMDPMSAGGVFPCRTTNKEGNITMPIRSEYEVMCLWGLYEATTADVIKEAVTAPVLDPTWDCDGGAPVDVEGYPITQYYMPDDECVLVGPTPAFAPINQNMPTSQALPNLILPRWPTGPDQRIVDSNPLYQYGCAE
eukprot:scaffold24472_cov76-Attheya_sp.AAC.1